MISVCSWSYVAISIILVLALSVYLCYDGRRTSQRHYLDEVDSNLQSIKVSDFIKLFT
ncbi:unnamed protein product [Enterobius vermicularis]|uniref:Col_cuticle_N domain-containing protein n=1 Tax=Enterobius vermicularis TaxID=51028 RepID=A0A0N4VH68_ENTVE|nr:unnamed protein product [Enterobius vermicularis]